jgi:membrane protease YdiL (CAAX protease family)
MEALILYFVLFFPGVYASSAGMAMPFSILRELGRTITYTMPSLALLWYLISISQGASSAGKNFLLPKLGKPRKKEVFSFAIGLPGLVMISSLIWILSRRAGISAPPKAEGPADIWGWLAVVFSSLGTGYLEESYFRYYLLTRLKNPRLLRIAASAALFAICHIYEGPLGILNAFLAGVFLSVLFIRRGSLHGIAWAHGAYNGIVYLMGNLSG